LKAPPSDVIEVSLIGPGYGESIVVHIGDGEWIIVDSCLEENSQSQSSAVAYLNKIGVDFAKQVSHVIATHWHDDHIGGLSEVVDCCEFADFCCAMALRGEEFLGFAAVYAETDPAPSARSTQEIIKILEILEQRGKKPKFLLTDTLIRKTEKNVKVFALSPSNERVASFLSRLAEKIPELGTTRTRMGDMRPNDISVVLLIDLGDDAILLGADLEEMPGGGWSAIANDSQSIKNTKSSVYKVAHHGSKTGEFADIWENLLIPTPFAILTPFSRGRKPLPSKEDVKRIRERTTKAYSSARLTSTASTKRNNSVEKTIRRYGWGIRKAYPKQGHVRLRRCLKNSEPDWSVELFGNATHLKGVWSRR